ncbi:calcium/sodium antiporter [Patescibacteria group bacterium]|nr:calcium/sodium antiporter [Patescibacteria group bacterium]MBU4452785.1 calcium/sodium antiporter [Patescibacteria group bacterium]MCG2687208.1 calcium/sodium antiporter [Candidatus Parcubacteria bacterium]
MLIYILFVLGFLLLIKGADLLVDGSSSIAKKLKISSIVIGLTIVAFGTSAPELIVNIFASISGNTEIAIGNVLGSNIANVLLVLGICAIIYPIKAKKNTVSKEIPFALLAAIIVGIAANDFLIDGTGFSGLTRIDGIVFISFFAIFLYYTFGIAKLKDSGMNGIEITEHGYAKSIIYILLGLAGLTFGGKWIVDGAVHIAEIFNVSQSLIGLTVVAIGTSLPELATSAVAAYKKNTDIAIGNIVGSNIFNIFWILGVSSIIRPLPFQFSSNFDIGMTIFVSILLFALMFIGKKHVIERWQGILMVVIYVAYVAFLIIGG